MKSVSTTVANQDTTDAPVMDRDKDRWESDVREGDKDRWESNAQEGDKDRWERSLKNRELEVTNRQSQRHLTLGLTSLAVGVLAFAFSLYQSQRLLRNSEFLGDAAPAH